MSQLAGWLAAGLIAAGTLAWPASTPVEGGQETGTGAGGPRNIVFIFTDDQRFDGLGLRNDYFETPHLDRLAEGGVLFENAFVTTSLCSPSRASILSGLYAHTHQVLDNSTAMPRDLPTFPVGLQAAGYRDRVHRQVAHGRRERRPAAGVRPLGLVPGAGPLPRPDPERERDPRRAAGVHHRPPDRLRGRVPARPRRGPPVPALPVPQGGARAVHAGRAAPRRLLGPRLRPAGVDGRHRGQLSAASRTGCGPSARAGTGSTACTTAGPTSTGSCRSTPRR